MISKILTLIFMVYILGVFQGCTTLPLYAADDIEYCERMAFNTECKGRFDRPLYYYPNTCSQYDTECDEDQKL